MTTGLRLSPGDPAPEFDLPDDRGGRVRSADLRGGRVIVYCYPAAMTPGCTTQASDFRDSLDELTEQGYTVIGLSPDEPAKLAGFREAEDLNFTLASDVDKTTMRALGAYGEKQNYGKTVVGVIRSTFVIGSDGSIELAQYNVRANGHVAKLKRDLAALPPVAV